MAPYSLTAVPEHLYKELSEKISALDKLAVDDSALAQQVQDLIGFWALSNTFTTRIENDED